MISSRPVAGAVTEDSSGISTAGKVLSYMHVYISSTEMILTYDATQVPHCQIKNAKCFDFCL